MKVYFGAGSKSIEYTEGVLNSCGKTLLRVWEALLQVFLESFTSDKQVVLFKKVLSLQLLMQVHY